MASNQNLPISTDSNTHNEKLVVFIQQDAASIQEQVVNVNKAPDVNAIVQSFQVSVNGEVLDEQQNQTQILNINALPVNTENAANEAVIAYQEAHGMNLECQSNKNLANLQIVNSTAGIILHNGELAPSISEQTVSSVLNSISSQPIQDGFSNMVFATIQAPQVASLTAPITFQNIQSHQELHTQHQGGPPMKSFCKYFCVATHEEVEETIRKHTEETFSHFVVAKKTKAFGSSVSTIDINTKFRIHWQSRDLTSTEECAVQIPYEGIPFIYIGEKAFMCHLGRSKATKQKEVFLNAVENTDVKVRRHRSRLTKKQGCPAKIFVKQIAKFPEFSIPNNTEYLRTQMSQKLRKALNSNKGVLEHIIQYVGTLPEISEHSNHEIGESTPVREPIDPIIRDKIVELAWQFGETVIPRQIKESLDDFVENDLFRDKTPPSKQRRRFYPNEKDIGNYVYKAKILSKITMQEIDALNTHIQKIKQENPEVLMSFEMDIDGIISDPNTLAADSPLKYANPSLLNEHRIVFCCQSSDQQHLLKRFGKQVILTEVSREAANLPFPLFGVFVGTNLDFQLVYLFMVQSRSTKSIKDGLRNLVEWNPYWSPKFLSVDFLRDRLPVFEELFPDCHVYINDSSRIQCWNEWLDNPFNASTIVGDRVELYDRLEAIANSYTEDTLNKAAQELENSDVWKLSEHLREWFSSEWLAEAKRWVVGYRHDEYMSMLHLHDTRPRDLDTIQESHYTHVKVKKLGEFISEFVGCLLPQHYQRYVERNVLDYRKQFMAGKYVTETPAYLLNKPASVIQHLQSQINESGSSEYTVSQVQPGLFFVQDKSENDVTYSVSFGDATSLPSCGCLDWLKYKLPCTHMVAIFHGFQGWGWDMLSALYIGNPVLTLDFSCFDKIQEDALLTVLQGSEKFSVKPKESHTDVVVVEKAAPKIPDTSVTGKLLTIVRPSNKQPVLPLPVVNRNTLEILTTHGGAIFKTKDVVASSNHHQQELATDCDNVCQELSTTLRQVDDSDTMQRSMLQKVKLDLQFVLNDVKLELSRLPPTQDNKRSGDKRAVSVDDQDYTPTQDDSKKVRLTSDDIPLEGIEAKNSGIAHETFNVVRQTRNGGEPGGFPVPATSTNGVVWLDDPELDIKLFKHHHAAILNGEPLSLEIIRCVQKVLRHQFNDVTGFADPEMLERLAPSNIFGTEKKVLQVHRTEGGHWAASARIKRNIHIYCCTLTSKAAIIQQVLKLIEEGGIGDNILFIERPEEDAPVTIKNCGLYAIAYCVAFAFDIEARSLVFDEVEMRGHLAECLEDMCFSMFPLQSTKL